MVHWDCFWFFIKIILFVLINIHKSPRNTVEEAEDAVVSGGRWRETSGIAASILAKPQGSQSRTRWLSLAEGLPGLCPWNRCHSQPFSPPLGPGPCSAFEMLISSIPSTNTMSISWLSCPRYLHCLVLCLNEDPNRLSLPLSSYPASPLPSLFRFYTLLIHWYNHSYVAASDSSTLSIYFRFTW